MKAIGRNLIIKKQKEGVAATKGGLLLAEKQREDIRYIKASVISPEEATKAGLNEGDLIYYDRHAGHTIEIEGDPYQVIKMQDIVVVL